MSDTAVVGDGMGDETLSRSPSGKHIVAYQFRPDGSAHEGSDETGDVQPSVPRMPSLFGHLGPLSNSKNSSKQDLHADSPLGSPRSLKASRLHSVRQEGASSQGLKTEPSQASQSKSKGMGSPQRSARGRAGNPEDLSNEYTAFWNGDEQLRSPPRKAKRGGGGFCYRYGHQQKDRVRELLCRAKELNRPAIQQVWEPSATGEVPAADSPRPQPKPRTPRSPREESPRRPSQSIRREQELYRLALRIAANTRAKQLPPEASLRAGLSSSSSQRHHRAQEKLLTRLQKNDALTMSAPGTASYVPQAVYEDPGFDPVWGVKHADSPIQYIDSGIMAQSPSPENDGSRPGSRQLPYFAQPSTGVPGTPFSSGRHVVTEIVSSNEVESSLKSWQKLRLKPILDPSQVYEGHLNHFFPNSPPAPRASARDHPPQGSSYPQYIPYGQRQKKAPRWR